jgi:hypothetical protein
MVVADQGDILTDTEGNYNKNDKKNTRVHHHVQLRRRQMAYIASIIGRKVKSRRQPQLLSEEININSTKEDRWMNWYI